MPARYPLAPDHFREDCVAVKITPDKALLKVLEEMWQINTDEPEKRLALLPKIVKLASDFKKSKEVIAAGPKAVKMIAELIDYVPQLRKELEKNAQAFRKVGAQEVGVQFKITDWNGKPFEGSPAFVTFESPGVPTINENGKIGAASFKIDSVKIRPTGMVSLDIKVGSENIEGVTAYDFKPGTSIIRFEAEQHSQNYKTRAKSLDEVKKKYGFKGSAGVEFKVISIGGEASKESEYNEAREEEVEWELKAGIPTFKNFKQV